jgi:hypothetical protein
MSTPGGGHLINVKEIGYMENGKWYGNWKLEIGWEIGKWKLGLLRRFAPRNDGGFFYFLLSIFLTFFYFLFSILFSIFYTTIFCF